jgi:predicted DNA-binding WGR domain protein
MINPQTFRRLLSVAKADYSLRQDWYGQTTLKVLASSGAAIVNSAKLVIQKMKVGYVDAP